MVRYSLNEIEASSRKAARGAGMPWGLAEEAGKATRWLAARGLPNVSLLLTLLRENDGKPYELLRPESLDRLWHAAGGILCPIIAGSALNDVAERISGGETFVLNGVSCPALVLPVLGRAAKYLERGFQVTWRNGNEAACISILPDRLYLNAVELDGLATAYSEEVRVSGITPDAALPQGTLITRRVRGVPLEDRHWSGLQAFAARTYVPATEESRLRGAGAGVKDED